MSISKKEVLAMSLDITIKERKEFYCPNCGAKMDREGV